MAFAHMTSGALFLILSLCTFAVATPDPSSSDIKSETIGSDAAQQVLAQQLMEALDQQSGFESMALRLRESVAKDTPRLSKIFFPTLTALPRNSYGKLEPAAIRHILHKYFLQQHAWNVEGLLSPGADWSNSSFKVKVFESLPPVVAEVLNRRIDQGLDGTDAVTLAATIKFLLNERGVDRLTTSWSYLRLPPGGDVTVEEAFKALDVYMGSLILGLNINVTSSTSRRKFARRFRSVHLMYPGWKETQKFAHEKFLQGIVGDPSRFSIGVGATVSFDQVRRSVEGVDDSYGLFQDKECQALKSQLLKMGDRGTGRVSLADFHNKSFSGQFFFSESVGDLRKIGALDETNPNNLRVIVPNYVLGPSNCIGASSYHEICCVSECGSLLGAVESGIGKSEASPDDVATLVASLASASVPANRILSDLQMTRLRSIAAQRDSGLVPIYGRLFAQWMHHAYPLECPYPHLTGSTQPFSIFASPLVTASKAETDSHTTRRPTNHNAPLEFAQWSNQEELPFSQAAALPPGWMSMQILAMLMALSSFALTLMRAGLRVRRVHSVTAVSKKYPTGKASRVLFGDVRAEAFEV